jgi:hypothetical protein
VTTHNVDGARFEVVVEEDATMSYRQGYATYLGNMMRSAPVGVVVSQFWRMPKQGQSTELSPMTSDTARKLAAALLQAADALDALVQP